jgi:copper chaperone CopZ
MAHGEAHEMLPGWLGISASVFLVLSLIGGYFIERLQKSKKMTQESSQTLRVDGMTCSHCEATVTRNLSKLEGIEEVMADKNTSQVKIKGAKIDLVQIEQVITDLGYQYKGIY